MYQCSECNFNINKKRKYLQHLETHSGYPLSCLKCKATFNNELSFEWHKFNFCLNAKKVELKFNCTKCTRKFTTKRNLLRHQEGHKRNTCNHCKVFFNNRKLLAKHLFLEHSIKFEEALHKCSYCDKKYVKKQSVYFHMRQHFDKDILICFECGEVIHSAVDYEKHLTNHYLKKKFLCTKCGVRFARKHQYRLHLIKHNYYKCASCNISCATKKIAYNHKRQGHRVVGISNINFICPLCCKTFTSKFLFNYHVNKKHSGVEKAKSCKLCNKSFALLNDYHDHCSNELHQKLICVACKTFFPEQHVFDEHTCLPKHPTIGIKCPYCPYNTTHKSNLKRHISLHSNNKPKYICEQCGKEFLAKSSLEDHISYNHYIRKLLACNVCGKTFKRKSELVRHYTSHTDKRPFICSVCGKSYKQLSHLRRHEKSAHNLVSVGRKITVFK